jgi:hypothetical protein
LQLVPSCAEGYSGLLCTACNRSAGWVPAGHNDCRPAGSCWPTYALCAIGACACIALAAHAPCARAAADEGAGPVSDLLAASRRVDDQASTPGGEPPPPHSTLSFEVTSALEEEGGGDGAEDSMQRVWLLGRLSWQSVRILFSLAQVMSQLGPSPYAPSPLPAPPLQLASVSFCGRHSALKT